MNKKGQGEIVLFAVVFVILFFVGGIAGVASLPQFPGRFFISGLLVGAFGTGAGAFVIKVIFHR